MYKDLIVRPIALDELVDILTVLKEPDTISFAEEQDEHNEGTNWWTIKVVYVARMCKILICYCGYCDKHSKIIESYLNQHDYRWKTWLKKKLRQSGMKKTVLISKLDYQNIVNKYKEDLTVA